MSQDAATPTNTPSATPDPSQPKAPQTEAERLAQAEAEMRVAIHDAAQARKATQMVNVEVNRLRRELEDAQITIKEGKTVIKAVAAPARMKGRHYAMIASFGIMVLLPVGVAGGYLYTRAADQYSSTMAFVVRSEDIKSNAADLLGGLGAGLAGGSSSATGTDSDILYEFMQSPDMVRRIDEQLNLREMFSRTHAADPYFSLPPEVTIEDLTRYWQRMVQVNYNTTSHLMEVRALAFSPEDARKISESIYSESSRMINELSDIARADSMRYAQEDLDIALERLKKAREAVTQFRLVNEIVDVEADIQSQMGLLSALQGKQTEALIELDLLTDSARSGDPRLDQAQRRLAVINERIADERRKFGAAGNGEGGTGYANTVADYERISVDREFAERAYVSALSAFDTAKAEASRQSRYLAAYIRPTLAQQSDFPQRALRTGTVALFSMLIWIISTLVFYALRERR